MKHWIAAMEREMATPGKIWFKPSLAWTPYLLIALILVVTRIPAFE